MGTGAWWQQGQGDRQRTFLTGWPWQGREGAVAGEGWGLERSGTSEPRTDGGVESEDRTRQKDREKG